MSRLARLLGRLDYHHARVSKPRGEALISIDIREGHESSSFVDPYIPSYFIQKLVQELHARNEQIHQRANNNSFTVQGLHSIDICVDKLLLTTVVSFVYVRT